MVWNKRMLTVEDANSIIKHFGKGFVDYYTLDTRLLTTPDTWFAYDFIDVYRVTGSISFKVKNSLWTGGFKVVNSNVSSPTVSVSDGTITVSKTGLEWVVLLLELSPEFNHGQIFELAYEVEYTPCIRPFYEDIYLTMGFLNGETPVTGMSVTDKIESETLTTDNNGLVTVTSGIDKYGDYDYILECSNNSKTVDYNYPYIRVQAEFPVILLNSTVYRDKINTLQFKFLFDSEYSITEAMLFTDNHIRLKCGGTVYTVKSYDTDTFTFEVPIGLSSTVNMVLEIGGNSYVDNYTVEMTVPTSYVSVSTGTALDDELGDNNPAGTIVFTGDTLNNEIHVNNDVTIRFTDDVESEAGVVFIIDGEATLTLDGISFTGTGLVEIGAGKLVMVNCSLQHCTGTVITGTGDLTVNDCSFIDNYSCIDINGDVTLENTLFDLSDTTYLDSDSPAFVKCYQSLTVDYCQFNLDLHELTNLGLSYVMLLLGKDGTVNSKSNRELLVNESFPIRHNQGTADVESTHYHITSKSSRCMIYTIEDSNTVYSNDLNVEYVED